MPQLTLIMATYRRFDLVNRSLKSILNQTNPHWRLHIVHDGPAPPGHLTRWNRLDPRVSARDLKHRAGDWGQTPRLAGLNEVEGYVAFWDDDNWYAPYAVEEIHRAIRTLPSPDLILMPSTLLYRVAPPKDVALNALKRGDIDQSMIVCRASVAQHYLPYIRQRPEQTGEDFALFQVALQDGLEVHRWVGPSICQYDGVRRLASPLYRNRALLHLWGAWKHHRRRFLTLR